MINFQIKKGFSCNARRKVIKKFLLITVSREEFRKFNLEELKTMMRSLPVIADLAIIGPQKAKRRIFLK